MKKSQALAILSDACRDHPILFKDELGDPFLLTKVMEIYCYSNTVLQCYCWHKKTYLQLQKSGLIFDDLETSDRIYVFKVKRENLPRIYALGAFKRRPRRNGRWLKDKEHRLGHRITPQQLNKDRVIGIQRSDEEHTVVRAEAGLVSVE